MSLQSLLRAASALHKAVDAQKAFVHHPFVIERERTAQEELDKIRDPIQWESIAKRQAMLVYELKALAADEDLQPSDRQAIYQTLFSDLGDLAAKNAIQAMQAERTQVGRHRETGFIAAEQGKDWKDNPWQRDDPAYAEWERGWCMKKGIHRPTWRPIRDVQRDARAAS